MPKSNRAEAAFYIATMLRAGRTIQIANSGPRVEVTVWRGILNEHDHYQGETVIEALAKAAKESER